MPHKLVFATNNHHKLEEVAAKIGSAFTLLTLDDIGCTEDIAETGKSFEENASLKSKYVSAHYDYNCFGDDSGLEIDALNGEPGIFSARYAGTHGDHTANIEKVLNQMQGTENRKARFRTVISLIWNGAEYFFEGKIEGSIRGELSGAGGFGYDPIFQPDGYDITFAEMSLDEKNKISHRGKAVENLVEFLKQQ
ncbi:non-canonical purine NTP diphosphatase [Mucilaginibacter ginkgonis]|uniref:dITP/XTP pyrophosphatase n=1 Tax=Mucilaginibacter ginkgonis TaxID=2682091 RepID=A0A6I4I2P2_9SPHI|nr:non-canonical purine NTP diphosphatase [Mucilaginibacter ginkgonis]QQL49204.1 non-canonical purine NTP diphosphatase [Mucilaginibacter ginkgonis]